MSLLGIDVGSSSVKVGACSEEGQVIAVASHDLPPLHPAPGLWETDPEDIWQATSKAMQSLMSQDVMRHFPVAVSW